MFKNIFFFMTLILFTSVSANELKWLSLEEAVKIAEKENKTILIDFYTDWCGWCKKMDKETYSDKGIIKILNANFVVVKINPEKQGTVKLKSGEMSYRELANEVGVRGYPATVFFTPDFKFIELVSGYFDPENMKTVLNFMEEQKYNSISFQDYRLFTEVKKLSTAQKDNPKYDFILGYFHLTFFNEYEKAHARFQEALNKDLKSKELYAALSLSTPNNSESTNKWLEQAKKLGYKDKSEIDDLVVTYVREIFAKN